MVTSCGVHLPHDVVMVGVDCAVVGASGLIGLGVVGGGDPFCWAALLHLAAILFAASAAALS